MSIGLTSDRLPNGSGGQGVAGCFCLAPMPDIPANRVDDPLSLPDAQVASLRRALELEFGPDLSGIRVYIGACRHERC